MSERKKGKTSVSLLFRLTDAATGSAKTALDVTTLKLQYVRPGEAASTATPLTALAALTTAFTEYGAKEVDATNAKGVYRVDAPDAAFATGADEVALSISGAAIETASRLVDLVAVDAQAATNYGLSALPTASPAASGGLPTVDASNAVKLQSGTGANQISLAAGLVTVGTNNDKAGYTASTVSDKAGYSLTQSFPANFADMAITATTGKVTVGTNDDKTGYTASTVSDKTGYSLTQAFPANFADLAITATEGGVLLASDGLDAIVVEAGINARQALSLILCAAPAGIITGAGTAAIVVRNPGDTADRVLVVADSLGNRSAVTLTPPV